MSEGITEQELLDSTNGLEHEVAKILSGYNVIFHNRARLDACKKIAALFSGSLTHVPGCRCDDALQERDPLCDDPSTCRDAACPVGATTVGWPHPIDTEGCSAGALVNHLVSEFNNLLTVIIGYSSLLAKRVPQDSPYRSNVEELKKASDRANLIIRQLLQQFLQRSTLPAPEELSAGSDAGIARAQPANNPTFEEYLRFWMGHGNSIFIAALSDVSNLEMIVAPQISINARSTLGQFRFRIEGNTVQKLPVDESGRKPGKP